MAASMQALAARWRHRVLAAAWAAAYAAAYAAAFAAACAGAGFALGGAQGAHAAPAVDLRPDAALEARVQALAALLRCLVCQNQSLADSNADLALDLKNQVREQLRAGRSEADVLAYMTARYGDFVLYRPPLKGTTLLLWLGPALLLFGGSVVLWRALGRSAAGGESPPAPSPDPSDGRPGASSAR